MKINTLSLTLNSFIRVFLFTGLLLLIPLIAMQFTDEVKWTLFDFVIAGFFLFTSGILIETIKKSKLLISKKITFILVVIVILFLIWIELAVGIFNTPFSGN